MASNKNLKIVFGSMTIGEPGTLAARLHSTEDVASILDLFKSHGHLEVDSSRQYGSGTTEKLLAAASWRARGLIMQTKLYPNAGRAANQPPEITFDHTPGEVRRGLLSSLKALATPRIDLFYLHGPDRKHPYEDTLREVDALHREGYFARFGVSNFMAWEVAQMCEICIQHGWIRPTVYQGPYNALQRRVEDELMPCLRFYGMAFYAFQPLAGGFLTGKYDRDQVEFEKGSRFDPESVQGKMHRGRYWDDAYFEAVAGIREAAGRHGIEVREVALRWLKWHAQLSEERGDGIIVGASRVGDLEGNLQDLEKGPLPEEIVEAVEMAWPRVRGLAQKYWH